MDVRSGAVVMPVRSGCSAVWSRFEEARHDTEHASSPELRETHGVPMRPMSGGGVAAVSRDARGANESNFSLHVVSRGVSFRAAVIAGWLASYQGGPHGDSGPQGRQGPATTGTRRGSGCLARPRAARSAPTRSPGIGRARHPDAPPRGGCVGRRLEATRVLRAAVRGEGRTRRGYGSTSLAVMTVAVLSACASATGPPPTPSTTVVPTTSTPVDRRPGSGRRRHAG